MRARSQRAWRASLIGPLAVLLPTLGAGCSEPNRLVKLGPPEVSVALPVARDVTHYIEVTGTAQPVKSVDIRARVKGFLKERLFKEGAIVKQGQLLLVIEEEPFQVALDQARTRLAEADAALTKAKQSKAREVARAQVALDESQLQLARLAEGRQRSLATRGAGTREELDQVEATRKKAEAQVESSQATLTQAEADYQTNILSADANAGAARTAVRNAEIELGYCRMSAPITGRISRVNIHEGNLVGDANASLLATIVSLDPIYAYTNFSETDLLMYRSKVGLSGQADEGQPPMRMELGLIDEANYPHHGEADYTDPSVDPGTGTIRVRGVFPNPNGVILPGLFVRIRVPYDRVSAALLVPERALGTDQSGQYLYVVGKDDAIEYRAVKVGPQVGDLRVVSGPIGPADRVVVEGLLRARPAQKVIPKPLAETPKAVARGDEPAPAADRPRS